MNNSHMEPKGWYSRGYLPHLDAPGLTQSVTFRLYGTLPKSVIEAFQAELKSLSNEEVKKEMLRKIDHFLDTSQGWGLLQDPMVAKIVQQTLLNADGKYYYLHAWCVMPNHVHVLITPLNVVSLGEIVKGWKSISNRLIRRSKPNIERVWAEDFFDRYIRDEEHYWNEVAYINNNPVRAGLCSVAEDWDWSSANSNAARLTQ